MTHQLPHSITLPIQVVRVHQRSHQLLPGFCDSQRRQACNRQNGLHLMDLINQFAGVLDDCATDRSIQECSVCHGMWLPKVEQHALRCLHAAANRLWLQLYPKRGQARQKEMLLTRNAWIIGMIGLICVEDPVQHWVCSCVLAPSW